MAYNEERMLPYFLRHYSAFASEIWVFNNESTDATARVAADFGDHVRVLAAPTGGLFDEDKLREVKSHAWKPEKDNFDWVVAVDVDELLHHPNIKDWLAEAKDLGASLLIPCGFDMVADSFPETDGQIYDVVTDGVYAPLSSKPCCFDPKRITDLWLTSGSHWARPTGFVLCLPVPGLKLLHFHHMGPDYVEARYADRRGRVMSQAAAREHWLTYQESRAQVEEKIARLKRTATRVV